MLGSNAVDFPVRHWILKHETQEKEETICDSLYGKGFSYAFTLQNIPIDRSNVEAGILQHHYDLNIYGTTWVHPLSLYNIVSEAYSKDEIIFVNGCDNRGDMADSFYSEVLAFHTVESRAFFSDLN